MQGKSKILNVRAGEWASLVLFALVIASNMFTLEITFIISTSGFLELIGSDQLPLLWFIDMFTILVGTTLYSFVIDRWNRKKLMQGLLFGVVIFYLLGRLMFVFNVPEWITYPALYLIAEQQMLLLSIVLWTLANDVYAPAQTKRLFPLIAASSVIGGVLGNALAASSTTFLERNNLEAFDLLVVNIGIMALAFFGFWIFRSRLKRVDRRDKTIEGGISVLKEGWDFVKNVASFKYLAITMLWTGFALTIIEYLFLNTASSEFQGLEFQAFYGYFRIIQTLLVIFLQGVFAEKIIDRYELKRVFMFLPAVSILLVVSGYSVLLGAGLIGVLIARLLGRVLLSGLDEPARKSLQSMIPDERRGRVSAFLDGYLFAAGTIVGSLVLMGLFGAGNLGWLPESLLPWIYLSLGLVAAILSLWSANRMRKEYDSSMLNWRLARRKRRGSDIPLDL
jgi:MFS family permease